MGRRSGGKSFKKKIKSFLSSLFKDVDGERNRMGIRRVSSSE